MPVNLQSTPVTNSCNTRLTLLQGGLIVATMDPGNAQTLTLTFDQVGLYNPPNPPIFRTQNPNVAIAVVPGNLGYFSNTPAGVAFQYAVPGGQQQTVNFT